ncbi:hypothetical protein VITU9109_05421 [Vibrio tubiashii ATCC 19109]|uniref:Transposase n=1 Tax=Vibrio tubiashii ATCC 19109 TaxID=1051646 RepID=A0ABN0DFH0_9VIBR|nr:hypothetical protein VITU9109_05421 [Vibrio tubiashii ATCC 19109]
MIWSTKRACLEQSLCKGSYWVIREKISREVDAKMSKKPAPKLGGMKPEQRVRVA